jgi:tetratricopeptide (TPR) repeat protein
MIDAEAEHRDPRLPRVRIRQLVIAVLAAWAIFGVQRRAQAFVRHTVDDQELVNVRTASPAAADAYVQAEARLRADDFLGAEKLLASARALNKDSFLLARRHCQVLTELGRREAAISACKAALSGSTAMDERAYVGALMSGGQLVTPKDLVDAVREAANAKRLHGQPFSDAAFCEIAHHIGDDAMFSSCLAGLQTNAPGYFETTRWQAARRLSPWLYWAGWSLLAALAVLTLLHAFWAWFRRPAAQARKPGTVALFALGLAISFATPAHAQEPPPFQLGHFPINHQDPESQIPTIAERNADPLEFGYFLQDLSAEALKAERKNDYRKAVKYWRASAKAVPDQAVAFSHACRAYEMVEEREHALEYCSRALNLNGSTSEDFLRWGRLMVAGPLDLTTPEIQDIDAAITHLRAQANGTGPAAVIECQLGVKLEDEARLARCTSVLAKTTPTDPHTLTFQWSLAMKRHNYSEARSLLTAMSKTPMTPAAIADLRAATEKAGAWWRRPFTDARYGFGLVALIGLGVLFVFRKRAQLREVPPRAAPAS